MKFSFSLSSCYFPQSNSPLILWIVFTASWLLMLNPINRSSTCRMINPTNCIDELYDIYAHLHNRCLFNPRFRSRLSASVHHSNGAPQSPYADFLIFICVGPLLPSIALQSAGNFTMISRSNVAPECVHPNIRVMWPSTTSWMSCLQSCFGTPLQLSFRWWLPNKHPPSCDYTSAFVLAKLGELPNLVKILHQPLLLCFDHLLFLIFSASVT